MFINYNLPGTIDKIRLDQVIADEAANEVAVAAHLADTATINANSFLTLQDAFDALVDGQTLKILKGTYTHGTQLTLANKNNIKIVSEGATIQAIDPLSSAILLDTCNGVEISGIVKTSPNVTVRSSLNKSNAFTINNCSNINIHDNEIDKTAGAGIMVTSQSTDIDIHHNKVSSTMADGIHITYGSLHVRVHHNRAFNTGDDSYSSISYDSSPDVNSYIEFYDNYSEDSLSSGVSFEGTAYGEARNNTIVRSAVAGIRVCSSSDALTRACTNIKILDNTLINVRQNTSIGHPAILVDAANGDIDLVAIKDNTIIDPNTGIGIDVYSATPNIVTNVDIKNNTISNPLGIMTIGIRVACKNVRISDNIIIRSIIYGISTVSGVGGYLKIIGNTIVEPNRDGLYAYADAINIAATPNITYLTATDNTLIANGKTIDKLIEVDPSIKDSIIDDNNGDVFLFSLDTQQRRLFHRRMSHATSAPTTGSYAQGDIVYNVLPSAGGYVGWTCVGSGSPGTWKGFGLVQA